MALRHFPAPFSFCNTEALAGCRKQQRLQAVHQRAPQQMELHDIAGVETGQHSGILNDCKISFAFADKVLGAVLRAYEGCGCRQRNHRGHEQRCHEIVQAPLKEVAVLLQQRQLIAHCLDL